MNHIVHFKVKKKFHAPCGWEILPENYLHTSNNQCTISFAPGLFEWIRLPNNRRIYSIGVWNLSMKCRFKVVGGAKSSTSIYRGTTWIMYGFSSCTTSWGVNKLWRTSVVFMCINLPSNSRSLVLSGYWINPQGVNFCVDLIQLNLFN